MDEMRRLEIILYLSKDLHNLHSSPNISKIVKSRREILVGYVPYMGQNNVCIVLMGKPE
jgi:hypothetical protein